MTTGARDVVTTRVDQTTSRASRCHAAQKSARFGRFSQLKERKSGGELGIRTPDTLWGVYSLSRRAPSASRSALRGRRLTRLVMLPLVSRTCKERSEVHNFAARLPLGAAVLDGAFRPAKHATAESGMRSARLSATANAAGAGQCHARPSACAFAIGGPIL